MWLTIVPEKSNNNNTILYHYGISKSLRATIYLKIGTTCELRTINTEFDLKLKESDLNNSKMIKLA